ncbi:MAG TPA: pyridoxal-phosphate dependent enzyme, partial [Trueperaceae bacterium]|nr:pyridoxal-phosphate dependent enzyme [Trueperaceae bacterium]
DQVARTIADGVRSQSIGQLNFTMLSRYLAGVVTVTEAEIADAVRFYASKSRLVVEPTGAISLAALRRLLSEGAVDGISLLAGPTVVVASGGNVDPTMLCDLLAAKVE